MKKSSLLVIISSIILLGLFSFTPSNSYKCQISMQPYSGEGAYIITSLINPEGTYEETLYVCGEDDDWYNEITNWWSFYGKKRNNIDAITGETISGGQQKVIYFTIDNEKINKGYKLRFETAVEDQEYYVKDIEIDLSDESLLKPIKGSGFIRSIRILPQL